MCLFWQHGNNSGNACRAPDEPVALDDARDEFDARVAIGVVAGGEALEDVSRGGLGRALGVRGRVVCVGCCVSLLRAVARPVDDEVAPGHAKVQEELARAWRVARHVLLDSLFLLR